MEFNTLWSSCDNFFAARASLWRKQCNHSAFGALSLILLLLQTWSQYMLLRHPCKFQHNSPKEWSTSQRNHSGIKKYSHLLCAIIMLWPVWTFDMACIRFFVTLVIDYNIASKQSSMVSRYFVSWGSHSSS